MPLHLVTPEAHAPVDHRLMQIALLAARDAMQVGEVPIGAVVARGARVISSAHNAPITCNDPTAHAEILALRAAARQEGNYRLTGTTLYVTAEPCLMCVGALLHARVQRVVYGCTEPKGGALGSTYDVGRAGGANHRLEVHGGICADDAAALLRSFFQARRGA